MTANDRMAVSGMLADGLSVESADSGGWRLLHLAARANAADVAQLLLVRVARGSLLGSFGPEALRRFAAAPQSRGANANAKSNVRAPRARVTERCCGGASVATPRMANSARLLMAAL